MLFQASKLDQTYHRGFICSSMTGYVCQCLDICAHKSSADVESVCVGHTGELVIDGKTLEHVLRTPTEPLLAQLGSLCGSVVICRASPSQKAAIVKMMAEFEVHSHVVLMLLQHSSLQLLPCHMLLLLSITCCCCYLSQTPFLAYAFSCVEASDCQFIHSSQRNCL